MSRVTIQTLGRSSAYSTIAQVWRIASRLVLTPIIIAKLGLAGYGTWTILFSACAYIATFNMSFGQAYSKFTAEYDAKGDYRRLAELIGSGITLIGTLGFVGLTILWLARVPILTLFGVPEYLLPQAGQALLIVAFCVLLRMSFGCVFRILAGMQRLDLEYKVGMLASAVEFVVALGLLFRGYGLLGLALGHLCGQVCGTGTAWILCRRLCPQLHISPLYVSWEGLRCMGSLGGRFQLLALLSTAMHSGVKLVISALCGVSVLAMYELATKLIGLASTAGSSLIAPMMPAFAHLHAGAEPRDWRVLYMLGSKIIATVSLISLGFMALFADRAIFLWTAQEYPLAAWTLRVMVVGHFVVLLTGVGTASLRGRGILRAEGQYEVITALMMALLFVPAFWLGGYVGVVVAIAASLIIGSSWFLVSFARRESLGIMRYVGGIAITPVMLAVVPGTVVAILSRATSWHASVSIGRWSLAMELVLWGMGFAAATVLPIWYGAFSSAERNKLRGFFAHWRQGGTPHRQESAEPTVG